MIEARSDGDDHRLLVAQGKAIAADGSTDIHPDNLLLAERAARSRGSMSVGSASALSTSPGPGAMPAAPSSRSNSNPIWLGTGTPSRAAISTARSST